MAIQNCLLDRFVDISRGSGNVILFRIVWIQPTFRGGMGYATC